MTIQRLTSKICNYPKHSFSLLSGLLSHHTMESQSWENEWNAIKFRVISEPPISNPGLSGWFWTRVDLYIVPEPKAWTAHAGHGPGEVSHGTYTLEELMS